MFKFEVRPDPEHGGKLLCVLDRRVKDAEPFAMIRYNSMAPGVANKLAPYQNAAWFTFVLAHKVIENGDIKPEDEQLFLRQALYAIGEWLAGRSP